MNAYAEPVELSTEMILQGTLLAAQDLKCYFPVKKGLLAKVVGYVKAVDGVSFQVERGETFGLVGETACGKSTTARLIMGLLPATDGSILFQNKNIFALKGEELKQVRRRIQMVFQDPYSSLSPRLTIGKIIGEPLTIHNEGNKKEQEERVKELLHMVGIDPHHAKRYAHEFSGGQRQRVGIARALALNPELVVCDEPVSALDVSIQSQVLNLLQNLQARLNLTYFFISHDLSVVNHICDRVAVMYLGKIVEMGTRDKIFNNTVHPYTKALLSAAPLPNPDNKRERLLLKGEVPSPLSPPSGCHFHPRCSLSQPCCAEADPQSTWLEKDYMVACYLVDRN